MAWIKRNLFFVIASFVALVLMGVGIWMLVAQMANESKVSEDIAKQYDELKRLNQLNPSPGDANIDNIKNAKDQEAEIRAYIAKVQPFFQPIPAIPDISGPSNKVSNAEFAAELRNTVSTLKHEADQLNVFLPPDYYFTFEAQRKIMIFDPASLNKLAVQLGEVKAITEILFDAKINFLDGIRRENISTNDNNAPDYLARRTVVTPLAELSPYEVTFRCFSTELASVLSQFASSPNGFMVKGVNVEPTTSVTDDQMQTQLATPGAYNNPGAGAYNKMQRGPASPMPRPIVVPTVASGPQPFLTEKLFRVTLYLQVVKIKPPAPATK